MDVKAILFVLTSLFGYSSGMIIAPNNSSLSGNFSDTLGLTPSHYYMDHMCSTQRTLTSRDAILVSPWSSKHPRSTQVCNVGLKNGNFWSSRFVITFKEMDMYGTSSGVCIKSRLDLFDGHTTASTARLNGISGLCGTNDHDHFATSTSFLTMRYETNNLHYSHSQYFEAVITPFHTGSCKHDEFRCSNGRCIKDNMMCDSYNNCGDDSDEKNCAAKLAVAIIVGIVVGCVVFIAAIVGIVACCCCGWCCVACSYESL